MTAPPRRFFLAIRHRPSGGLLPAVKGYGFTRASPSLQEPPRLFTKIGPAKQALARWLEGALYEGSSSDDDEVQNLHLIRKPERKSCEMEIVEVEVTIHTFTEAQLRRL